ncbi:ROK family transcriptional regulator [Paramaledivibacter caminithermalis]|uniref:Sugar kinase of the NBD/HSP70 family, may contain an N-terminal HTH domain n=1 Tax=Paramaledivibacter caminithermalis (strain DSM 15212 / CIP 107654 / DViRD3) TaxID=1121301 RepID=A0A1M6NQW1_PARC5|nr:ROK family transcriptional regulator [Paramaledivibacter caminithermalis]SHJ98048.1 Sugar kinase of the NBD/HSP70 family, may contain an N-terminal HTH domain [Paramaledivibacter caminithermalis DSM 15212]
MKRIKKRDQEYIKQNNLKMILDIIKNKRSISRAEIVKITNMSPTSVSRIVGSLIDLGLVKETETSSSGVGRKAILLDLDLESVMTIGVYINKHIINVGIVNFGGEILYRDKIELNPKGTHPDTLINKACALIKDTIKKSKIDPSKIIGIGVSLPGIINSKNGEVIFSAPLSWENIHIAKVIESELNIKTVVDNDVKLKALAESLYGVGRNSGKTALVNFGRGVGSALIIDGEIFRGVTNIAGEIGHITIDPNGILCECGRRGCLQTFIVEDNLIEEANKVKKIVDIKEIFEAAYIGESWAVSILDRAITYMCITINNIVCMYNPDTIVLSGSLVEVYPEIIKEVEEKCRTSIWTPLRGTFKILYSELKSEADIIGPSTLALDTFLSFDI